MCGGGGLEGAGSLIKFLKWEIKICASILSNLGLGTVAR